MPFEFLERDAVLQSIPCLDAGKEMQALGPLVHICWDVSSVWREATKMQSIGGISQPNFLCSIHSSGLQRPSRFLELEESESHDCRCLFLSVVIFAHFHASRFIDVQPKKLQGDDPSAIKVLLSLE